MLQLAWAIISSTASWGNVAQPQPTITIQGPAINDWCAKDQEVSFDVHGGPAGIAGYTAKWDHDPGDPSTEPKPGSGNPFWDGPAVAGASKGSLHLTAAGKGCHTAYVRAWANTGQGSDAAKYGPICFGAPPSCTISYPAPRWPISRRIIRFNARAKPVSCKRPLTIRPVRSPISAKATSIRYDLSLCLWRQRARLRPRDLRQCESANAQQLPEFLDLQADEQFLRGGPAKHWA